MRRAAIQWEITMACNLACKYCYNMFQATRPQPRDAPAVSHQEVLRIAAKIAEAGINKVVVSGGEPLLLPEIVAEIGQTLQRAGVSVSVVTNGTLLSRSLAHCLKESGINEVFVSLHGPSECVHDEIVQCPGAFKKTVRGIESLVSEGLSTRIEMVVTQRNKGLVREMGFFAASLGASAFSASRVVPPWGSKGNPIIENLVLDKADVRGMFLDLRTIRERTGLTVHTQGCYPLCVMADFGAVDGLKYCSAGGPAFAVGPKGEIRPCALMPHVFGNVLIEGFVPALKRMADWRTNPLVPKECRDCTLFNRCSGGCRVTAHFVGDVAGLDMHANPRALTVALGLECSGG